MTAQRHKLLALDWCKGQSNNIGWVISPDTRAELEAIYEHMTCSDSVCSELNNDFWSGWRCSATECNQPDNRWDNRQSQYLKNSDVVAVHKWRGSEGDNIGDGDEQCIEIYDEDMEANDENCDHNNQCICQRKILCKACGWQSQTQCREANMFIV